LPRRTSGAVFLLGDAQMKQLEVLGAIRSVKESLEQIAAGMLNDDDAELTQAMLFEEASVLRSLEVDLQHQEDIANTQRLEIRSLSQSRRRVIL
jgi:hypothetical protein